MQSQIEDITFGVEIETTIPVSAGIRVGAYHAGFPVTGGVSGQQAFPAPRFNGAMWKVERDISIAVQKAGHAPAEFVSPVLKGEAGVRHLIEFLEFLRSIGATVNRSTGLHIHIGVSGAAGTEEPVAYVERLTRLVGFNTKALYAQTGTLSREKGRYCAPLGNGAKSAIAKAKKEKRLAQAAATGSRYEILNLTNIATRGTVEFRCFAGSLNTSKVLLHLFSVLLLAIVARKTKTPTSWDNRPLTGEKALTNLLKVRPVTRIVGAKTFAEHFPAMLAKALEMARKYDAAQAALDLITLSSRNA